MTDPDPWPYATDDAFTQKWTDEAFVLQQQGDIIARFESRLGVLLEHVSGPCPRCQHAFTTTRVAQAVVHKTLDETPDAPAQILVRCACTGQTHLGRPATESTGCGARYHLWAQNQDQLQ